METWLLEWSYMKNTTCAWYFRGENTMSFDCRMLLQTCKTAGEGKQMSCFKWWRMNWQTPIAEGRTNLKIWNFSFFLFFPFFLFLGEVQASYKQEKYYHGELHVCVHGFFIYLWTVFFFLFWDWQSICVTLKCSVHLLVVFHEPQVCAEVKRKVMNIWSSYASWAVTFPSLPIPKIQIFLKNTFTHGPLLGKYIYSIISKSEKANENSVGGHVLYLFRVFW